MLGCESPQTAVEMSYTVDTQLRDGRSAIPFVITCAQFDYMHSYSFKASCLRQNFASQTIKLPDSKLSGNEGRELGSDKQQGSSDWQSNPGHGRRQAGSATQAARTAIGHFGGHR